MGTGCGWEVQETGGWWPWGVEGRLRGPDRRTDWPWAHCSLWSSGNGVGQSVQGTLPQCDDACHLMRYLYGLGGQQAKVFLQDPPRQLTRLTHRWASSV